jgi:hypothetical protein
MKHIKAYENIKTIYNKNDFVLLTNNIDEFLLPYAQIIRRNKHIYSTDTYFVEILFPNTKNWAYDPTEEYHYCTIEDYLIIKKLSKKEIEYIKLKLNADKYNL